MQLRFLHLCVAATALLGFSVRADAQLGKLRAAAAKVDITPPKSMFPVFPREGMEEKFSGAHDPLFARALVLDNGTTKVALISVDSPELLHGEEMAKAVADQLKIPLDHLILCATHDHNAPHVTGDRPGFGKEEEAVKDPYYDVVEKGVLEAARQANAGLQPARVGFGTGKAYVNVNRDVVVNGMPDNLYNPDGPSDKTVAVLLITKPTGEPIAVYSNYPVHPQVTFGMKKDGMEEVTADLAGATNNYVEDHFKGAIGLWTMGAAGDQQPEYPTGFARNWEEGTPGYAVLDMESRRLGAEIVRVATNIHNTSGKVVLWGAQATVTCPGQRAADPHARRAPGMKMVDGDPLTVPISLIMINDIAIAGIAAEPFTEIGIQIKQDSIFDRTFVVTELVDDMGYLPTDKAYFLPSAQAVGSPLKPGCIQPALADGFKKLEESYLPVWHAATE